MMNGEVVGRRACLVSVTARLSRANHNTTTTHARNPKLFPKAPLVLPQSFCENTEHRSIATTVNLDNEQEIADNFKAPRFV